MQISIQFQVPGTRLMSDTRKGRKCLDLGCNSCWQTLVFSVQFSLQHCTALQCTRLQCSGVHCTALHCTALQWSALHCTTLHCVHCTAVHTLHSTAVQCSAVQCSAVQCMHCTALHCTAHTESLPTSPYRATALKCLNVSKFLGEKRGKCLNVRKYLTEIKQRKCLQVK